MIFCGDCSDVLEDLPFNHYDLVITSPPYGGANMPVGTETFDLDVVGRQIHNVLKPNGVCALIIQDKFEGGSKSLVSFRTALSWCSKTSFHLWADFIYLRGGTEGFWWNKRLRQDHDYIFIFVKGPGQPKFFDKTHMLVPTANRDGSKCCGTVLDYRDAKRRIRKPKLEHTPVPFPKELAKDLILMFTEKGDRVLDPFCGLGTVPVVAESLGRAGDGIELLQDVADFAKAEIAALHKGIL